MLDTAEAQSSGIHVDTAQLCVLEETFQRENLAGSNSSWRLTTHNGSGLWVWAAPHMENAHNWSTETSTAMEVT